MVKEKPSMHEKMIKAMHEETIDDWFKEWCAQGRWNQVQNKFRMHLGTPELLIWEYGYYYAKYEGGDKNSYGFQWVLNVFTGESHVEMMQSGFPLMSLLSTHVKIA